MNLDKKTAKKIKDTILQNNKIKEVILFGSRAKGSVKSGSDIDLSLVGNDIHFKDLCEISSKLDGIDLPYKIDLVNYDKISNKKLKEHIDRVGIKI